MLGEQHASSNKSPLDLDGKFEKGIGSISVVDLNTGDQILGLHNDGTAQPYGICVTQCDPMQPHCPDDQRCAALYHIRTLQPTGEYACLSLGDVGQTCLNTAICRDGLRCVRFFYKTMTWVCLYDCSERDNLCPANTRCVDLGDQNKTKVCKLIAKAGAVCRSEQICEDGFVCVPSGQDNPARCLRKCTPSGEECTPGVEVCRLFDDVDSLSNYACFTAVQLGEECHNTRVCAATNALCIGITKAYAACFQSCTDDQICRPNEICEQISPDSLINVCRPQAEAGEYFVNMAHCARGGHAVSFMPTLPPVCLDDCTADLGLEPAACGKLSPRALLNVAHLSSHTAITSGESGIIAYSEDKGNTWTRLPNPELQTYHAIIASPDGQRFWVAGQNGWLFRYLKNDHRWEVTQTRWSPLFHVRGLAISHDGLLLLAVGTQGQIMRSEDGGNSWQPIILDGISTDFYAVAFGLPPDEKTSPPSLIVGAKGLILHSLDGGKSWHKASTTPDISTDLFGVVHAPPKSTLAFNAIAVGKRGAILLSEDLGRSWRVHPNPLTDSLRSAAFAEDSAIIVGDNSTILRFQGNQWQKVHYAQATQPLSLYAVSMRGQNSIAVGQSGEVLFSTDGGLSWKETSARLFRCLPITLPTSPDVGACFIRCNPSMQGSDCPPLMRNCALIEIANGSDFFCIPSSSGSGSLGRGESCSPYIGAAKDRRCTTDLSCEKLPVGYICMQPCHPATSPPCPPTEKCLLYPPINRYFCGTSVTKGDTCNPSHNRFCDHQTRCVFNAHTGQYTCQQLPTKTAQQFCLSVSYFIPPFDLAISCDADLLCTGQAATPYRHFCAQRCNPSEPKNCPNGWVCMPEISGGGVCIESCSHPKDTCSIPILECRRPFSTSEQYYCL
jgi:photosystem II stability/assembly factor-like uncharacterized protein